MVGSAAGTTGLRLCLLVSMLGVAILVVLASLNYKLDDTITRRTIVDFVLLGIAMIVFGSVIIAGLASTGVRRLHDRGRTGYWLML